MSSTCKFCGSVLQNNQNTITDVKQDSSNSGWWCFSGFCDNGSETKINDDSSTTNSGTPERYERRKTIHFETDIIATARRKSARNYNSILKSTRFPQEVKNGFLLPFARGSPKVLLVFGQQDPVAETQAKAAERLGFKVTCCQTEDDALEQFQLKSHELVIVDSRFSKIIDYNTLCRSIRNTRGGQHSTIVAVVRKSIVEQNEAGILSLLQSGFNRCIIETTNLVRAFNEMVQLQHNDMVQMAQHSTCQSIYAALNKCRDVVIITDDSYRCQYANKAFEKYFNIRLDEMLGKTLQEQLSSEHLELTTMGLSLIGGREWNGPLTLRKKDQELLLSFCKATPVSCNGRVPSHYVLVLDTSLIFDVGKPRGGRPSIRKGSDDVRSVGSQLSKRNSLAKLNELPLEAPITKIISLIDEARDTSLTNIQVVKLLDRIEETIKTPELYRPQVRGDRQHEPIVSELISALLSKPSQPSLSMSSKRSSSSSLYRPSKGMIKVPDIINNLLQEALSWEFDIFRLEDLTTKRPLQYLGMQLFTYFDVANTLNCDEKTLHNWLIIMEANYHSDNSYHNSTHAADVMQATASFLERDKLKLVMESLDKATSLIAAAAHDVDHPGKTNAFLSNSENWLSILYNDITILESHHAALTFKLTLGDERVNIFKNLDKETYKVARHNVIDMILATEMTRHFENLAKFVNAFGAKPSNDEMDFQDLLHTTSQENKTLIKRMMIKCSDVSNPTRPLRLCVEWARRIAEEYFRQTDEEKERGLPVVMPMFDRNTSCSIPKSQIGFVDYVISNMFDAWNVYIDMPELISYMNQNYVKWNEFEEQGISTLAHIVKLQRNALMRPMFPLKSVTSECFEVSNNQQLETQLKL